MSWHGQINRTIWEIREQIEKHPDRPRYRRELLRAHFLQRFEYDKAHHVPRDDRTFLIHHADETPTCLLLHGAQGTPAEMRELGNSLYQNGVSVYCPRLSRVDTRDQMVTWESWLTQADTALDTVMAYSKNAFVVGLSLGGTIAMVLSSNRSLQGVVLLAPAIIPRPTLKMRFFQIARFVLPTLFYHFAGWNGEVLKAMDYARKSAKRIRIPVLAMQASDDHRLSLRGIRFIRRHARLRRNDICILRSGGHVLTRGTAKDEVFEKVRDFVHRNSNAEKTPGKETSIPRKGPQPQQEPPELTEPRRSPEPRRPRERRDNRDRRRSSRKRSTDRRSRDGNKGSSSAR